MSDIYFNLVTKTDGYNAFFSNPLREYGFAVALFKARLYYYILLCNFDE